MKAVVVVGIGDDGCVGLSSQAMGAVARANILAGGERHLDFFPEFDGKRITLKENITAAIDHIAELSGENTICILASGDPLFYGIGNLVRKKSERITLNLFLHRAPCNAPSRKSGSIGMTLRLSPCMAATKSAL